MEVAHDDGQSGLDRGDFDRLVESWAGATSTTIFSDARYALQVSVQATGPALALSAALWRWKDALRHAGLPEGGLVRAELLTPDELEREILAGEMAPLKETAASTERVGPSDAVEDDLLRRALHDTLTGLLSREIFLDDVRRALAAGSQQVHGMVVLDLQGDEVDGPSRLTLADEVLVEIARRVVGTVRRTDSVARVGAQQLAVLVHGNSAGEVDAVAARILDRVGAPLLGSDRPATVTASLGLVMATAGDDADVVLLNAERAARTADALAWGVDSTRRADEPMI